jgi:hypothetical protein
MFAPFQPSSIGCCMVTTRMHAPLVLDVKHLPLQPLHPSKMLDVEEQFLILCKHKLHFGNFIVIFFLLGFLVINDNLLVDMLNPQMLQCIIYKSKQPIGNALNFKFALS